MPIAASDLVLRLSGGAANTDPNAALGGARSTAGGGVVTTDVLNNVWDNTSGAESSAGDIEYRGVYILNNHGSLTATDLRVWISSNTTSTQDEVDIALADEAINATMETIANESTAPVGPTFSHPTTFGAALVIGNVPFGEHKGIWLRRTVDAGAAAKNNNAYTLSFQCETAE